MAFNRARCRVWLTDVSPQRGEGRKSTHGRQPMQTRHRIPTIFNLSMVDVLCCALGCIILLWLVYFKEARERAQAAGKTNKELAATKLQFDKVSRELTSTQQILLANKQKHDYLQTQFVEATAQR